MKFIGNHTIQITQTELDALTPWHQRGMIAEGDCYSGSSTADQSPMVVKIVRHPLEGPQPVWFSVQIESGQLEFPRAFNSCNECHAQFPGPRGATYFVNHACGAGQ